MIDIGQRSRRIRQQRESRNIGSRLSLFSHDDAPLLKTLKDSREIVYLCFPKRETGREQRIDVTVWFAFPNVAKVFVDVFYEWALNKKPNVRAARLRDMTRGFFLFLSERGMAADFHVCEISTTIANDFIGWLCAEKKGGGPRWSSGTRTHKLFGFRNIVEQIKKSKRYKSFIQKDLVIRRRTGQYGNAFGTPREILNEELFRRVAKIAREEVAEIVNWLSWAWAEMEKFEGSDAVDERTARSYAYLPECLHTLDRQFPDPCESFESITNDNRKLASSVNHIHGGLMRVRRYLYPSGRALVPFVILLSIYTDFNVHSLLDLKFSEIDYPNGIGGKRIRLRPPKARSGRRQLRSFAIDDEGGPAWLISFIESWTNRLRKYCSPEAKDIVFLYHSNHMSVEKSRIHGFITLTESGNFRSAWKRHLDVFIEEHNLPKFSLAQIRPSTLDFAHEVFDGDLRTLTVIGGQRSAQTIDDHYTSDSARKRNDERLAQVMVTRERWIRTKGRSADVRREPHSSDPGAATPGFRCFDPFASPIPGEVEGRICGAYGACPGCPLAHVLPNDPYVLARLAQLARLIDDARNTLEPRRWLAVWAPRLNALRQYWVRFFDDECVEKAKSLTLSPLPELE